MSHFRGEWSEKPGNLSNLLKVRQIVRRNSNSGSLRHPNPYPLQVLPALAIGCPRGQFHFYHGICRHPSGKTSLP